MDVNLVWIRTFPWWIINSDEGTERREKERQRERQRRRQRGIHGEKCKLVGREGAEKGDKEADKKGGSEVKK